MWDISSFCWHVLGGGTCVGNFPALAIGLHALNTCTLMAPGQRVPKVTIIYRYIFFFAILGLFSFCRYKILLSSLVMLKRLQASKTFVCMYKFLRFYANLQNFKH